MELVIVLLAVFCVIPGIAAFEIFKNEGSDWGRVIAFLLGISGLGLFALVLALGYKMILGGNTKK